MRPVADARSENVWTDKVHSHRNLYFRLVGPGSARERQQAAWQLEPETTQMTGFSPTQQGKRVVWIIRNLIAGRYNFSPVGRKI